MKRTPMKRTAWPRKPTTTVKKARNREQRLTERAQEAINSVAPRRSVMASTPTVIHAMPKTTPVRSDAYRRAVASLPCVICGVSGYSQAAHGSGVGTGASKGMGIKACDTTLFPACCDRPGVRGCHSQLDQGAMFRKAVRHELEPVWAADTQRRIYALGMWPEKLPYPGLAPAV